jgi:hypothetical protein
MVLKTLSDCKGCPHLTECDAHITYGHHKHKKEPDPCELEIYPNSDQKSE